MYLRLKAKWLKDSNKLYSIGQYLMKILNNQQKIYQLYLGCFKGVSSQLYATS